MKSTELRIGNLINHIDKSCLLRVSEISNKNLWVDELPDYHYEVGIEEIKPIPLTEEWLLKFGFENTDIGLLKTTPNNTQIGLIGIESNWSLGLSGPFGLVQPCFIQFVHQIQNLYFCLCGEELNLTKL